MTGLQSECQVWAARLGERTQGPTMAVKCPCVSRANCRHAQRMLILLRTSGGMKTVTFPLLLCHPAPS